LGTSVGKVVERLDAPERRHDLDWLRVLAVLLLFPYHTARMFEGRGTYYVRNDEFSVLLRVFEIFLHDWHMSLFFLISGAATWFSLNRRTGGSYVKERVARLVVPLVFCTLVFVSPQVYCQRLHFNEFQGSYFQFYPQFFNGLYPRGNFSWSQLWFLAYLFTFSLVALPLFVFLKKAPAKSLIDRLAAFSERRGAIFLAGIPLALIEAAFRAGWPGRQNLYNDWANFLFYIACFMYGYLLHSDPRFGKAAERNRKAALGLGFAAMAVYISLRLMRGEPSYEYSPGFALFMILKASNVWFWIIAILGYSRRYLKMQWNMGVAGKFSIITAASLAMSVVAYDLLVRRTNVTRFLFGLRTK
jgi:glucan biosynthesis protein C